jgi:hypothetical protein
MESEPLPEHLEICFNLWMVSEEGTDLVYCYMGKAYGLRGTREEKLRILHTLSADDHHTVSKRKLPERFTWLTEDGPMEGVTSIAIARGPESVFWAELLDALAKEIPPQTRWMGDRAMEIPMLVREDPLCVTTLLIENEHGILFPQVQPFPSQL